MDNLTPMQKQYFALKEKHSDAVLLFRLGDFYEAFNEDAKIISDVLDITLTGRGKGETRVPMAGIPYHAIDNYLYKLVQSGYKVAIAEQLTEPQMGKIVERDITRIVTAGTFSDSKNIKEDQNNYIGCVYISKSKIYHLALLDVTTGEFRVSSYSSLRGLTNELSKSTPSEILISEKYKHNTPLPPISARIEYVYDSDFTYELASEHLLRHFKLNSLEGYGFKRNEEIVIPAGVLLRYVKENQKTELNHILNLKKYKDTYYMDLDSYTIFNLELLSNIRISQNDTTLYKILNKCSTSMGMRLLRDWITRPLINKQMIENRLDAVQALMNNSSNITSLVTNLKSILDIERLIAKIGTGSINGRDLIGLKNSLIECGELFVNLNLTSNSKYIHKLLLILNPDNYSNVIELINDSINEDCPVDFSQGGVIKAGLDNEIDELKELKTKGHEFLKNLQQQEIKRTGILNLKVKYNKVFGFYIEITKSNIDKVPIDYIRKQTLVNAERYITPELKEYEEKILSAQDKLVELELKKFAEIINNLKSYIQIIQAVATTIAKLDVIVSFVIIARERNYIKPDFSESEYIIKQGRHPVVELIRRENYIPNDINFDNSNQKIALITGPNMSGKSTYIRQAALISIRAQMGCFVPAGSAKLKVFDRIFTRVGAADNLAAGESTFMVEMIETANILNNATSNSLIILDEVGRGTSTYDGVAIAWSIVEYLAEHIKAFTLFATHYHELTRLADRHREIVNYHIKVKDDGSDVVFTHQIARGAMGKSYGVNVAEMAGIPHEITQNAKTILKQLESSDNKNRVSNNPKHTSPDVPQFSLFD